MECVNDLLDIVCKMQIHLLLLPDISDKITDNVNMHKIITNIVYHMPKSFPIDVNIIDERQLMEKL